MEARYQVDGEKIVHEVLDQEAMVVNLDNGYYYALEGTAVDIWQALAAGASAPEAAVALLQRYTGNRAEMEAAVRSFLAELVAETLLTPIAAVNATAVTRPEPAAGAAIPARPFQPPVMYKYTDMANLIQMDPIREFDETGWPKRSKN